MTTQPKLKRFNQHILTKYQIYNSIFITLPFENEEGNREWKSINLKSGKEINYLVNPKYSHYSVILYDEQKNNLYY